METAKRDFVAFLRLIVALLSILGTVSIVVSVVRKKQILNPKVHPIFSLCIADFLLAILWVVGGCLWVMGGGRQSLHTRVGCFAILLITVILECVTINLTCVYALLAYSGIKKKDFSNVYSLIDKAVDSQPWRPSRIILAYLISWILPVVLIMVPFSVVASAYHLVREANLCSCWCLPYFGNVVPLANPRDNDTAYYMHHMSMLVGSYSVIVMVNYLVGFILLVVVYTKILRLIKAIKAHHSERGGMQRASGATANLLSKGQSQAKQKVVYFLTVFIICGLFNLLLSVLHVLYQGFNLSELPHIEKKPRDLPAFAFVLYICQSVTVPLQGFLNAIVYGWTREDFILAVTSRSVNVQDKSDWNFSEQVSSSYEPNRLSSSDTDTSLQYTRSIVASHRNDLLYSIPE